ncbi:oxidoreductase [Hydrogenophaga sp. 2FB]|uniref:oxidoreductase n=1 Tax=Hydrogenophaga sp. 2FB TaxID=2502187 RepID=UPI0010F7AB81|nr:oxidoreductase [Hydrogenophaga sp. 2FB]
MKPTNRTWLITGCDKGMGYEIAQMALNQGDNVAVTVLNSNGHSPLTELFPDTCRSYHLNVTEHEAAAETIRRAEADFSGIDVLVNNAGYGLVGAAEETSPDEYRRLFDVNFFGLVECTRAALPGMRKRRKGHIINFSSLVGFIGFSGMAMYSASKFAVEGFSESLAKEVAHLGIHVTLIEPGGFRSDFAGGSLATSSLLISDYEASAGLTRNAMKSRHGTQPGDPARLALALFEISRLESPPLRLPLGPDAWQQVSDKAGAVAAEVQRWKDISFSTSFQ